MDGLVGRWHVGMEEEVSPHDRANRRSDTKELLELVRRLVTDEVGVAVRERRREDEEIKSVHVGFVCVSVFV